VNFFAPLRLPTLRRTAHLSPSQAPRLATPCRITASRIASNVPLRNATYRRQRHASRRVFSRPDSTQRTTSQAAPRGARPRAATLRNATQASLDTATPRPTTRVIAGATTQRPPRAATPRFAPPRTHRRPRGATCILATHHVSCRQLPRIAGRASHPISPPRDSSRRHVRIASSGIFIAGFATPINGRNAPLGHVTRNFAIPSQATQRPAERIVASRSCAELRISHRRQLVATLRSYRGAAQLNLHRI
jgi:hypothetical protein